MNSTQLLSNLTSAITENQAALQLVDYMMSGKKYGCQAYHINSTCNQRIWEKFHIVFMKLLKINLPIHIIPLLLFKLKQLKQKPIQTFLKLVFNLVRSAMFLTSFVLSIFMVQCYGSRLFPNLSIKSLHILSSLFAGLGIAFEQAHKRVEITYFCLPRNCENIYNTLDSRNLVLYLPGQDALCFAVAMGMIAMCYSEGKNSFTLRGFTAKACKYLWTDTQSQNKNKKTDKLPHSNNDTSNIKE
eukprot:403376789